MVENKSRGRGRPRCFDEKDVLDKAVRVFWSKGFHATSLDDLSEAMGIGRPSMYGAFGDKDAIFMRCLERYVETICLPPVRAFEAEATLAGAILAYLTGVAEYATCDPCHKGCMLGSVAAPVDNPEVRNFVANRIASTQSLIAARFQADIDAGSLPPNFNVPRAARRVINAMLAISARARHGTPLETLLEDAQDGTQIALTPCV